VVRVHFVTPCTLVGKHRALVFKVHGNIFEYSEGLIVQPPSSHGEAFFRPVFWSDVHTALHRQPIRATLINYQYPSTLDIIFIGVPKSMKQQDHTHKKKMEARSRTFIVANVRLFSYVIVNLGKRQRAFFIRSN
jgi:hypothetical protein